MLILNLFMQYFLLPDNSRIYFQGVRARYLVLSSYQVNKFSDMGLCCKIVWVNQSQFKISISIDWEYFFRLVNNFCILQFLIMNTFSDILI